MRDADRSEILQLIRDTARVVADEVVTRLRAGDGPSVGPATRLLTVRQTAAYLNMSRSTLDRLERAGVLQPKRFGRRVLYERSDLDAFLANPVGTR